MLSSFMISSRARMVYRLPVRKWLLWHWVCFGHSTNWSLLSFNKYSCTASKMEFMNLCSTPEGYEGLLNQCTDFGMKYTCSKWTEFTTRFTKDVFNFGSLNNYLIYWECTVDQSTYLPNFQICNSLRKAKELSIRFLHSS